MFRIVFFFLVCVMVIGCDQPLTFEDSIAGKINGLVFTGPPNGPLEDQMISSMDSVGANFVAFVPEATVYRQSLKVIYDFERQWFGEKTQATLEGIALARQSGLKVMLKPHLDVSWDMSGWKRPDMNFEDSLSRIQFSNSFRDYISTQENKIDGTGSWRGEFMVKDENDWQLFESGYEKFIMEYAIIADSLDLDLFCIGTEMKRTALEKPDFWRRLIKKVRTVYHGPITYAANWDSYDKIEFWDELDYIGVDAYFPVSNEESPQLTTILNFWNKKKSGLESLAREFERPIIFTEWGYESENYAGKEPWIMGSGTGLLGYPNPKAQSVAYEGMFQSIWEEPWMKGVFVWRWSPRPNQGEVPNYSPRDKEASEVLRKWFK